MNNLLGKKGYENIQQSLDNKLRAELKNIGDEDFKTRDYYLDKWNLELNGPGNTHVDYKGFLNGRGVV